MIQELILGVGIWAMGCWTGFLVTRIFDWRRERKARLAFLADPRVAEAERDFELARSVLAGIEERQRDERVLH